MTEYDPEAYDAEVVQAATERVLKVLRKEYVLRSLDDHFLRSMAFDAAVAALSVGG